LVGGSIQARFSSEPGQCRVAKSPFIDYFVLQLPLPRLFEEEQVVKRPELVLVGGADGGGGGGLRFRPEDGVVAELEEHLPRLHVFVDQHLFVGKRELQAERALEVFVEGEGDRGAGLADGVAVGEVLRIDERGKVTEWVGGGRWRGGARCGGRAGGAACWAAGVIVAPAGGETGGSDGREGDEQRAGTRVIAGRPGMR